MLRLLPGISSLLISTLPVDSLAFFFNLFNYIPQALNTGTCIHQGNLFYSADLHRNHVLAKANTGEIGKGFGKNAGEWSERVEISKEENPGSKRSMYGYILTYSRL